MHTQDADQKPPADKGKHAPLKKTPFQSIIGCDQTGIFMKKAPIVETKKERKKPLYNTDNIPKVNLIVAFYSKHALTPYKPLPELHPILNHQQLTFEGRQYTLKNCLMNCVQLNCKHYRGAKCAAQVRLPVIDGSILLDKPYSKGAQPRVLHNVRCGPFAQG